MEMGGEGPVQQRTPPSYRRQNNQHADCGPLNKRRRRRQQCMDRGWPCLGVLLFLAWSVGAVPGVDRGEPALYFEAAAQSVSSPTFLEGQPVKGLVGSSGPLLMFGGSDIVPSRMPVSAVSWAWTPLVL